MVTLWFKSQLNNGNSNTLIQRCITLKPRLLQTAGICRLSQVAHGQNDNNNDNRWEMVILDICYDNVLTNCKHYINIHVAVYMISHMLQFYKLLIFPLRISTLLAQTFASWVSSISK